MGRTSPATPSPAPTAVAASRSTPSARRAGLRDYVAIARPDHWGKHVFVVPGIVLALLIGSANAAIDLPTLLLGFVIAAAISSANYVLNEWLDARFDAFHPTKSQRPAVVKQFDVRLVVLEYVLLLTVGLGAAWSESLALFVVAALFAISGLTYNARPVRTKDQAYLDVASEAMNNPIRLTIGWLLVDPTTLPPASLLLAYWTGGAFLMSVKRLAEYRTISASSGLEALHSYRASFRVYTESKLGNQSFLYAQLAAFFLAVFLIKYRVEYILAFPLFAILFTAYFHMGLQLDSTAQAPERLFKERTLLSIVLVLVIALGVLTVVDFPSLAFLSQPHLLSSGTPR